MKNYDYNDKEAYLKYFYLIDLPHLIKKIDSKLTADIFHTPDELFDLIFYQIEEACNPYIEFVHSPLSFNYTDKNPTYLLQHRKELLRSVLMNHCIIHGLLTSLDKAEPNDVGKSAIYIRGANDTNLKTGYFKTNKFADSPSLLPNGREPSLDTPKNYNACKRRFDEDSKYYSYQILRNHQQGWDKGFFSVLLYWGNWACFIYTNPTVNTVNRNIYLKNDYLLSNYDKLLAECIAWCKENKLLFEDKLLFEYAMESIYGFSFFCYASKLLNKIHNTSSEPLKITYKDFEGSLMLNLIQQTAQLPIIYNRSVFLEHCLSSVMDSKYLKSQEYQRKSNSLFSYTSRKQAPKELLLISGLDHIEKYLQKLKYIVLPLLETLWDTVIHKLNEDILSSKGVSINTEIYRTYIHQAYPLITQDYSCVFENKETLNKFCADSMQSNILNKLYQEYSYKDALSSKYECDSFKQLLLDYFKPERPFSSIPSLYDLLTTDSDFINGSNNLQTRTVELNFHKNHFQNILSFAENITPFIQ